MSATFKDAEGREWSLRITVGLLPKLRSAGFDVGAATKGPEGLAPLADPETLGRVLWVLVEPQATAKGVTPESFVDAFDGEAIYAATGALVEAITGFTQPPAVAKRAKELLPGERAKIEAEMIRVLEGHATTATSNGPAGSTPASPASTPAS